MPQRGRPKILGIGQRFTFNLLLLLLLNVLVKPVWLFGIDRGVQNAVGAGAYGVYYALFSLSLMLNMLLDMGLTAYNNRALSRNPSLLPKFSSRVVGIKLVLLVLYAVVVLAAFAALGYSTEHLPLVGLLIFNQFLASVLLYLRSNLNALQRFAADSLLSVLDKLLMVLLFGLVLWGGWGWGVTVLGFVLAQSAAYLLTLLLAAVLVVRMGGQLRPRLHVASARIMLRRSWPFALLALLMAAYYRIDVLMVERLLPQGGRQAGVYAQAYRLFDAYLMFPYLVSTLLLPIFGRLLKHGAAVDAFLGLAFRAMLVPVLALAVPTGCFAQPLMELLYHSHVDEAARVLPLFMGSFVCISVSYILGTLLTAHGAIRGLNVLSAVALALGVALQLLLLPALGLRGAALAGLCMHVVIAVAQVVMCYCVWGIGPKLGSMLRYVLFVLLTVFISVVAVRYWPTVWGFAFCVGGGMLLSVVMGLIRLSELRGLLRGAPTIAE